MTLSINGSGSQTGWSSSSSSMVTLSTANSGDIVVVAVTMEQSPTALTISSVTSSHLTFTFRGRAQETISPTAKTTVEFWAAQATGSLTSEVITVTSSASVDDGVIFVFGVSGSASPSAPWDSNASLPYANDPGNSGTYSATVSTDSSSTMLLWASGNYSPATMQNPGAGWSSLYAGLNGGAARYSQIRIYYKLVSSTLASASFTTAMDSFSSGVYGCSLFDAIRESAPASTARPVVFVCT